MSSQLRKSAQMSQTSCMWHSSSDAKWPLTISRFINTSYSVNDGDRARARSDLSSSRLCATC